MRGNAGPDGGPGSVPEVPRGRTRAISTRTRFRQNRPESDERVIHYSGHALALDITGTRYAIGSGADFALGAMRAGKSAMVTMSIACALAPNSGICGDHQGTEA